MMQALEVLRYVVKKLENAMNSNDKGPSVYVMVIALLAELKTVENICEKLPNYEQSDVIDAYLGKMEETNEP